MSWLVNTRRAGAFMLCLALLGTSQAQPYPSRAITVVVPAQAGTTADAMMRILTQRMGEGLKQNLVIDNVVGAGGVVGADRVARSAPDGYTLGGFGDSTLQYAPHLMAKVTFDPLNDFDGVSYVAGVTWVLVVHPSFPATSLQGLVREIQAHPGKYSYASGGNGSPQHIAMALFAREQRLPSMLHIPFKGTGQAIIDVMAGRVPVMFTALGIVLPYINEGKLRPIAVPSTNRSPLLPSVPTFSEAGMPFRFNSWAGIYAPKGTSRHVIDRLNAEVTTALATPDVRQKLMALGLEPRPSSPEELNAMTRNGYSRMKNVIRDMNIKSD